MIEVWSRAGGSWASFGVGQRAELSAIGCRIEVDAVYADAGFTV